MKPTLLQGTFFNRLKTNLKLKTATYLEGIKRAEALYLSAFVPGFVMLLGCLPYLFAMAVFYLIAAFG